jgi:hypothetical protein
VDFFKMAVGIDSGKLALMGFLMRHSQGNYKRRSRSCPTCSGEKIFDPSELLSKTLFVRIAEEKLQHLLIFFDAVGKGSSPKRVAWFAASLPSK